jgi:hypothetical protein
LAAAAGALRSANPNDVVRVIDASELRQSFSDSTAMLGAGNVDPNVADLGIARDGAECRTRFEFLDFQHCGSPRLSAIGVAVVPCQARR